MPARSTKPLPSRPSHAAQKQVTGLRRLTSKLKDLESQATEGPRSETPAQSDATHSQPENPEQSEAQNQRLVEEELAKYIADGVITDSEDEELDNGGLCRYWQ
ncbi:hypothetical protein EIP86_010878, partial [Pleurotus ostreatoroseus]